VKLSRSPVTGWRRWIWVAAVLFALMNVLVMVRRLPILRMQQRTPEEIAAEEAARWLRHLPPKTRLALLVSHQDITPVWFHYRLGYFLYPRRHELVWDALPPDAARRYDLVLAFGSAQEAGPTTWKVLGHVDKATLLARPGRGQLFVENVLPYNVGIPLRLSLGLWSLAVAPIVGLLILGWTTPRSPFRNWPASLALAHLVGAGAMAWIVVATTLATGRLLVWPVYALLLILMPGAPRAWRWLRTQPIPASPEPRSSQRADVRKEAASRSAPRFAAQQESTVKDDTDGGRGAGVEARQRAILWALAAMIALGVISAVMRGGMLGLDWDGYAIWQLKAEAFFLDGTFAILRDPVHFSYAHLDYPLLAPIQTWWVYAHFGGVADGWAQAAGFLFYVDLLVVFWAAARRYVDRIAAGMGIAILACLPEATQHAVSGFADIPLALGLLVIGALLVPFLSESDTAAGAALPWALGTVTLIKNEGILAAVAALTVILGYWIWIGRPNGRGFGRSLALCLAAIVAANSPWLVAKRAWRLQNDLLEERVRTGAGESLPWRLGVALTGYVTQLARIGPWLPAWGLLIVLFPLGAAASWQRRVVVTVPLWALLAVQLTGYTVVYLITPLPLQAHMGSSVDRLILHLVPGLLLASVIGCFGQGRQVR
jgi:hypothetical protein